MIATSTLPYLAERCDDVAQLAKRLDLRVDRVIDSDQARTIATLLDGAFELLKQVEAVAEIPGAAWDENHLALLRATTSEFGGRPGLDVDDLRRAVYTLMSMPEGGN
jgi:hypothetical protein